MPDLPDGASPDGAEGVRAIALCVALLVAGCSDGVDRQAMKQARQTIELCDSLLAKGQTTINECLKLRKQYEERFGRRY